MDDVVFGINESDFAGYCDAYGIAHSYCRSTSCSENELLFEAINEKVTSFYFGT